MALRFGASDAHGALPPMLSWCRTREPSGRRRWREHHLDATAAKNNVIVTVFLCLLVFVFIKLRPVRAVLLDVAPLAAPVANVFFI